MPSVSHQEDTDHRIAQVERLQDQFDIRLRHVEITADKIAANVETLVERQATRQEPISWKQVLVTILTVGSTLAVIWSWVVWSVENAPATRDVVARLAAIEQQRATDASRDRAAQAGRHTAQDELIDCLRAEILNRDIGWRCSNPARGIPQNDVRVWRPTVTPGS